VEAGLGCQPRRDNLQRNTLSFPRD
jgi:hypothetical protein